MSQVKDPMIKLFGKTIGLPETVEAAGIREPAAESCDADTENSVNPKPAGSELEDGDLNGDAEDHGSQERQSSPGHDSPKEENQAHPSLSNETNDTNASTQVAHDSKEDPTEPSNSNEKTLKKPDKLLPCPRCNSTDTKFCYFNNYNVNQPRHFCKNCHRYWTAGGAMRNVPVGAGRRKNKSQPASQFRPVPVREAARGNPNGTSFLVFGSDTHVPLGESVLSVLNIGDETSGRKENSRYERRNKPPILSSKDEVASFHGVSRPHPWNFVQCSPLMAPPIFDPASFPIQFYASSPTYLAGPSLWNISYAIPHAPGPTCGPNSAILGKHSRDESIQSDSENEAEKLKEIDPEKCLCAPKTLRIDDPGEASRSSIWSTLCINKNRDDDCADVGISDGHGLFKVLQRKSKDSDEKNRAHEKTSTVLKSNPAALSRSVSFHERS